MRLWILSSLIALLVCGAAPAQDAAEAEKTQQAVQERARAEVDERLERLRERVRRAARLPGTIEEARREGATEEEVQEVLKTGREQGIPAGDMQEILEVETEELREGHKDNFGAAVREMKASGLRGRDLAAAIHAEQIARGMKKPKHRGKPGGHEDRLAVDADEHADELDRRHGDAERVLGREKDRAKGKAGSMGKGKAKGKAKGR